MMGYIVDGGSRIRAIMAFCPAASGAKPGQECPKPARAKQRKRERQSAGLNGSNYTTRAVPHLLDITN